MSITVSAFKVDEAFMRLDGPEDAMLRIYERFSFFAPKYVFDPRYKAGVWDGQIHLMRTDKLMYLGLIHRLKALCDEHGWGLETDWDYDRELGFTAEQAGAFAARVIHKPGLVPYDFQLNALVHAVRHQRRILLSPTASGKSLAIYLIAWFIAAKMTGTKVLIVVPLRQLAKQLVKDFDDYSAGKTSGMVFEVEGSASLKEPIRQHVVISTWQSIYKQPAGWFEQFSGVIGDEVHRFKATSLKAIMEKLGACPFRIGLTGSMDGTQTNEMILEGLFGRAERLATTKELQDRGIIAQSTIRAIVLKHPKQALRDDLYNYDPDELDGAQKYEREIRYLSGSEARNEFICKLARGLPGNTLILFERVDIHGVPIYEKLHAERPDETFFIHGDINVKYREIVRAQIEQMERSTTVASLGTFSTGINVKRLNNVIFAFIGQAKITLLQSIGRVLRIADDKTSALLIDIADDLRMTARSKENYTLRHFKERIAIYQNEKHPVSVTTIAL